MVPCDDGEGGRDTSGAPPPRTDGTSAHSTRSAGTGTAAVGSACTAGGGGGGAAHRRSRANALAALAAHRAGEGATDSLEAAVAAMVAVCAFLRVSVCGVNDGKMHTYANCNAQHTRTGTTGMPQYLTVVVETNNALLTAVFELFGTLPPVPELLTTTFRLISRFAAFMAAVPDCLAAAVEYAAVVGCAGSPASGAPPAGLPIASPVQELAALSLQTLASYALPAARALYLALPPRLPLLALQHSNAVRLLECCAQAVALSAAGEHEAPLAAVLAPYVGRLDALARDPAAGVAAAGSDGSLLAICTAKDGLIEHANAVDTGLNVAGLELLVTAAVAGGGAIDWHPDVLPLDRVSATLARNALDGIAEALYACRVQSPSVLAAALGAGPADRLPLPPGHPVAAAMAAAEASLANAIASAVAHLWPTLSAVAVTFAGNRDVLTKVARLLNFSIRSAGAAAFPPLLPSVIDAVVGIDASLQGDAELCYLARLITTKYRDLPDLRLPLLTMVRMFCNCVAATY